VLTRKAIQKHIFEKTGIDVVLCKDNGCFYFTSDDDNVLNELVLRYTTLIYVDKINDLTLDEWLKEFIEIWECK
jgi:hypothetical protein